MSRGGKSCSGVLVAEKGEAAASPGPLSTGPTHTLRPTGTGPPLLLRMR